MNWLSFSLVIAGLILLVGAIAPLVIEAIKNLLGKKEDSQMLALVSGLIIAIVVYGYYILFFIIGHYDLVTLDIIKLVAIGLGFIGACAVGSQTSYDKIYQPIIEWLSKVKDDKEEK